VGRCLWWIAEDVIEPVQQGAKPHFRRLEHMFVRLDRASDGTGNLQQDMQKRPATDVRAHSQAREPSVVPGEDERYKDAHTSSFVRSRSTTADVNSVVPACPPRSGVLHPDATVSSVAS
jgi:hypothetical protein